METRLHQQLKARYGAEAGGRTEVVVDRFRVDAVTPDGQLVEVQSGALGPLRAKLDRLLRDHRVRVVKPVVVERRIVRRALPDGPDLSARQSPRRGEAFDVFDDLVGISRIFPHPRLQIDVLAVAIDEVRVRRRRRPGHAVVDRLLRGVLRTIPLKEAGDLWTILPDGLPDPFSTLDLANQLRRPAPFAQRVAYCLRLAGAAETRGKMGRRPIYTRM